MFSERFEQHKTVMVLGRLLERRFVFFNDTATTVIYTLSLHDALPISRRGCGRDRRTGPGGVAEGGDRAPDDPVPGGCAAAGVRLAADRRDPAQPLSEPAADLSLQPDLRRVRDDGAQPGAAGVRQRL